MDTYFSQHFDVSPEMLETYGAFDVSIVSDLPLFVDPFLLFNSEKPEYQALHAQILKYLEHLRDQAADGGLDEDSVSLLYRFKEVKQNWFGYTLLGNGGHGLGRKFAASLHSNLGTVLSDFGSESVTLSSHLEKVGLIGSGIGRDGISDFTTNLIKDFLLDYTQTFAKAHLKPEQCDTFQITKARFNYKTGSWQTIPYYLPALGTDFVLLTPVDMLSRDETWINYSDMVRSFQRLPDALPNNELRAQVNGYFHKVLKINPTQKDREEAAARTIREFPELIDYYIRLKEEEGDQAESVSIDRVNDTRDVFTEQLRTLIADIQSRTDFYAKPWTSYDEALERVKVFKHYIEHQDGYRLINRKGKPFSSEAEVQLYFGLLWCMTEFDVNREPNNGRGPVDFKVSYGAGDKSLIEFKLASNSALKRNLQSQIEIYEAANRTKKSVKAIVFYTAQQLGRVQLILRELKLESDPSIILIDARWRESASKA